MIKAPFELWSIAIQSQRYQRNGRYQNTESEMQCDAVSVGVEDEREEEDEDFVLVDGVVSWKSCRFGLTWICTLIT